MHALYVDENKWGMFSWFDIYENTDGAWWGMHSGLGWFCLHRVLLFVLPGLVVAVYSRRGEH